MTNNQDRIEVRGLELLLYCGVLPEEQARRQPFLFDLDLYVDLSVAGGSDNLDETVNYGELIDQLSQDLANERFQLLERLATRMAELIMENPLVNEITVKVAKLRPPVAAHVDTTGVSIHRRRS